MTAPLTAEDLLRLKVPMSAALSPDGTWIAYEVHAVDAAADENVSTVWIVGADGAAPARPLSSGRHDRSPFWTPAGDRVLVVAAAVDGIGEALWSVDPAEGTPTHVADLPPGSAGFAWSPDGTQLLFTAVVEPEPVTAHAPIVIRSADYRADGIDLRRGRRRHVHVLRLGDAAARVLTAGDWDAHRAVWSPDGARIAFVADLLAEASFGFRMRAYVVFADAHLVTAPNELVPAPASTLAVGWDSAGLLLVGQEEPTIGHLRLFVGDPATGEFRLLAPSLDRNLALGGGGWAGGMPTRRPDGRVLVALVDDSRVAPFLLDPATGAVDRAVADDVTVAGLDARRPRIATVVTRPGTFGEVAVIDDDGLRLLTSHTADALPDRILPEPRRVHLDGAGDSTIAGWMFGADLPASAPLYVDIHGGPHLWWGPATHHANLYHVLLTQLGWRVLLADPRGSDGYGEEFYRGSLSSWGRGDADDLRAAISAVGGDARDRGVIVAGGYSYGGYLTARLCTLDPRIDAAVIGGGITDLLSLAGTHDLHQTYNVLEFGGDVFADPTVVDENSPIRRVAEVTAPTLLLHGELDGRCPLGQAEQWYRALHHRGVPVELVRYPDADHQFLADGRPSHRVDYARRIVAWAEAARARRA